MLLVGFFPCAGKLDLRWDDQISRRFIFWDWQPTICCGDCLAWPSLLEPAHSSESECTSWTNRRIVLTKYHTARALEKLTLQVRLYWETMTRAEMESCFYTRSHYEDKEWASWLPVYLSILHMHSVRPHLHSTAKCESVHFHEHHVIAFCLSIGGVLLLLLFIRKGSISSLKY